MNILNKIDAFIKSSARNAWIETTEVNIYIRKAHHFSPKHLLVISTLDIASIEVYKPRNGFFTKLYPELMKRLTIFGFDALYVESVLNPNFEPLLIKLGMTYDGNHNFWAYKSVL